MREQEYVYEDLVNVTITSLNDELLSQCDGFVNRDTTAGDVKVLFQNGNEHTFKNVQPNEYINARIRKIFNEGSTVSNIDMLSQFGYFKQVDTNFCLELEDSTGFLSLENGDCLLLEVA